MFEIDGNYSEIMEIMEINSEIMEINYEKLYKKSWEWMDIFEIMEI